MLSKIEKLKQSIQGNSNKVTLSTEIYILAKELGCLGEILGREFEINIWKFKIIIKQKPMKIPTFVSMLNELEQDYKRQNKEAKKSRGRR